MWMFSWAVPQFVLMPALITRGSILEKLWAMLPFKTQAGLLIRLALPCISFVSSLLCFGFSSIDSQIDHYVILYKLVCPCTPYPEDGIIRGFFIRLDSLLFVRSVPTALAPNHLVQNLKLLEGPLKMSPEGGLPGNVASWIFLSVSFRYVYCSCSF